MKEVIDRLAARGRSESQKKQGRRAELRAEYPEFAALVDDFYKHFGGANAVVINGERFGKAPLPDRRSGSVGYHGLPVGESWKSTREDRRLRERKPSAYQRALEEAMSAGTSDDER